jgi:hypothetical protein
MRYGSTFRENVPSGAYKLLYILLTLSGELITINWVDAFINMIALDSVGFLGRFIFE